MRIIKPIYLTHTPHVHPITHTRTHTYIHTYTHTYTRTHCHTSTHTRMRTHTMTIYPIYTSCNSYKELNKKSQTLDHHLLYYYHYGVMINRCTCFTYDPSIAGGTSTDICIDPIFGTCRTILTRIADAFIDI